MNKQDLVSKLKQLEGLTPDERAYLTNLINTKKYGLVWEDKPEDAEELLRTHLPVLREVEERRITPPQPSPKGRESALNENTANLQGIKSETNATQTLLFDNEVDQIDSSTSKTKKIQNEQTGNLQNEQQLQQPNLPPHGRGPGRGVNHILIEGDNLHALTALTFTHEGKVDVMYFDPPYNTGNKDFKYNDSYVDKEDSYRHSKWLSFMDKRLKIAKRLLSDKGVVFISIDDNEQAQLKLLCDEVFGESNFTGQIIVETATDNNPSQISIEHEYLLCYSKNITLQEKWIGISKGAALIQNEYLKLQSLYLSDIELIQRELRKWIKANKESLKKVAHYSYVDEQGVYYPDNPSNTKLGGYEFEVLHPVTNQPCALPTNGFRFPKYTFYEMLKNGNVEFGKDEFIIPKPKRRLANVKELLRSIFYEDGRVATGELNSILHSKKFNNPKSIRLINYFLSFIPSSKSSIILDFFAGSGTTLHATMQLNAEDGGNRQCILVTNNENNICEEVTYERNKRVIRGYSNAKGVQVAGLANNNLRYYRTEFVPSTKTEQNKRQLTQASTDLLCIKEDCYTEITENKGLNPLQCRIFTNDTGKYMAVIYHSRTQWEVYAQLISVIKSLENRTEKVKLYAFSPEKETLIDDFLEVEELIEAVPLPEAIYNAYRATFRTLKLDKQSRRD